MSSAHPWYKRYPADFIHGTIGLTLEEKGAYSLVLDLIYSYGRPIPDDPHYIAGVCGCSVRKWNAIRGRLIGAGKLIERNGCLSNIRAADEIAKSDLSRENSKINGRKGGEKSAQIRSGTNKNNNIGQATLNHARATEGEGDIERKDTSYPKERAPKTKRGTRLPLDWRPDEKGWQYAIAVLGSSGMAERELERFRNYWKGAPGQKGVKLDWPATWRNWIMKAEDLNDGKKQQQRGRQSDAERTTQAWARAAHSDGQDLWSQFEGRHDGDLEARRDDYPGHTIEGAKRPDRDQKGNG